MSAPGKDARKPSGKLGAAIDKEFGSFDEFKTQFSQTAATVRRSHSCQLLGCVASLTHGPSLALLLRVDVAAAGVWLRLGLVVLEQEDQEGGGGCLLQPGHACQRPQQRPSHLPGKAQSHNYNMLP